MLVNLCYEMSFTNTRKMVGGGGGTFDFRVTPNPNFMLDVNLEVEFVNLSYIFNKKISLVLHV